MTEEAFVSDADLTARAYLALENRLNPLAPGRIAWAIFREPSDGQGAHADVIAINAWASRRWEIWGFEVKASRGDWLKELASPEKSAYFFSRCDRWWLLAARQGIMKPGELPKGWGLMELRGNRLHTVTQAEPREAIVDRGLVARILRQAHYEKQRQPASQELRAAEHRGYERGKAHERQAIKSEADDAAFRLKDLEDRVDRFQTATGLRVGYATPQDLALVRAFVTDQEARKLLPMSLAALAEQAARVSERARKDGEALRG